MISSKASYALRELARDYMNWPDGIGPGQTIVDDAIRLLGRKELSEEGKVKLRNELKDVHTYEGLNALAEELLVARQMSVAEAQAKGPKG
jgi:hypothetical protein